MSDVLRIAFTTLVILSAHGCFLNAASACRIADSNLSTTALFDEDGVWIYLLKASGPSWSNDAYGLHASGLLSCKACSAGGLYHFSSMPDASAVGDYKPPSSAAERATRSSETYRYPPIKFTDAMLTHEASRESISVGPLTGYAVKYRLTAKASQEHAGMQSLLVISLSDRCAYFETTIGAQTNNDDWMLLESILKEISIEKTWRPGATRSPLSPLQLLIGPTSPREEPAHLPDMKPKEAK